MITKNPMQLKAIIKNRAKELNITPQAALQTYCLERFLERISVSDKADCFIIKGGFLISSLIGIENRSTMDIDTTFKGLDVTDENLEKIFRDICKIHVEDQLDFIFDRVEEIKEADDYPGIRVHLYAVYETLKVPLAVDVTTGDSIVPQEICYSYHCVYDDKVINIKAYPLENVLAEKIETIISRGVANTRTRDFYDIYILYKLKNLSINWGILKEALSSTAKRRRSTSILKNYSQVIDSLREDVVQHNYWKNYSRKKQFVKDISFDDTLTVLEIYLEKILKV